MNVIDASKSYHRTKHVLFLVSILLDCVLLLGFFLSGWSVALRSLAFSIFKNFFIANAFYLTVFILGSFLIHLPLHIWEGFTLEHRFHLSNQKLSAWAVDEFKKFLLSLVISVIFVEVIYIFLSKCPQAWWFWGWVFWIFLTVFLARLTPAFIVPLFYRYIPIENAPLREAILKLFRENNIFVSDVFAIDFSSKTKKANAFVCGLGKNRRIVLTDTLMKEFSTPEIEAIVAHEISHYKHHDLIKMIVVNSCLTFLGFMATGYFLEGLLKHFSLSRIDDIAFLPMLALGLSILSFVAMPFLNAFSRALEYKADHFSLETTKNPSVFISMMEKLGRLNLAEIEPHAWIEFFLYDHPSISKRIAVAKNFGSRNS